MGDSPYVKTKPTELDFKEINRESELRRSRKVHIPTDAEKTSFGQEKKREENPRVLQSYAGQFCTHCKNLLGPDRVVMRMAGTANIRAHYHKTCAGIVEKEAKKLQSKIRSQKFWSAQGQYRDDNHQ